MLIQFEYFLGGTHEYKEKRTGSEPSLRVQESLLPLVRGGAIGDEGADFRRNGLRSIFTNFLGPI